MIFKIMLMTRMLALMKVYFSLLCVEWRKWMTKNVIECWLKCKNRYWIWFMRQSSFFALMNVSSRCWSPFHANKCVFSVMNSKRCNTYCCTEKRERDHVTVKVVYRLSQGQKQSSRGRIAISKKQSGDDKFWSLLFTSSSMKLLSFVGYFSSFYPNLL